MPVLRNSLWGIVIVRKNGDSNFANWRDMISLVNRRRARADREGGTV
jgi:hypothetical protein